MCIVHATMSLNVYAYLVCGDAKSYRDCMSTNHNQQPYRKVVALMPAEWSLVDDFRFTNRIATDSEAIRRVFRAGLRAIQAEAQPASVATTVPEPPRAAKPAPKARQRGGQRGPRAGTKTAITEQAAVAILQAAGRPVPAQEMVEAIELRGVGVGGRVPRQTLNARLQHSTAVTYQAGTGWRLRD